MFFCDDKIKVLKFIDENPGKSQSCVALEFYLAESTLVNFEKSFIDCCPCC